MKGRPTPGNSKPAGKRISVIRITAVLILVILPVLIWLIFSESHHSNIETPASLPVGKEFDEGKTLSVKYCQSCHLLPDPSLLSSDYWAKVLPEMGLKMGIRSHRGMSYESADTRLASEERLLYPQKPLMPEESWQKILDYYNATSPNVLPAQERTLSIKKELPFFSVLPAPGSLFRKDQMVSMVRIDNSVKPARLFVFEKYSNKLFLLNNKLQPLDSVNIDGSIVDLSISGGEVLVCSIGEKISTIYNDERSGKIFRITVSQSGKIRIGDVIFRDLARPVQIVASDLNSDGRTDYVLCEFGKVTGSLSWMENIGSGKFEKHILRQEPGAVKVLIEDNKVTGKPDIWVLFAQGDEGIFHYSNKGNGKFEEKQVLRFPPIYGSTSFDLADVNTDGKKDIIYTCGDNGDRTGIFKPYHGVYVFSGDGHDNYSRQYFFPVNGCYKVIARDFSGKGRIDLALHSLFIDPRQPEEGFVFLKNEGGLAFSPYSLPSGSKFECALSMDSGDIDGDGKPDLVIGAAYDHNGPFSYNRTEPMFLVLKNKF